MCGPGIDSARNARRSRDSTARARRAPTSGPSSRCSTRCCPTAPTPPKTRASTISWASEGRLRLLWASEGRSARERGKAVRLVSVGSPFGPWARCKP
eukprot:5756473-Prymnesium_polylepis.1